MTVICDYLVAKYGETNIYLWLCSLHTNSKRSVAQISLENWNVIYIRTGYSIVKDIALLQEFNLT